MAVSGTQQTRAGVPLLAVADPPQGWESMFMLSRETIHGGLACVFAASNVLLGVIGFCIAFALIKQGKELFATSLWVWSYVVMIGILGFGYRRFLYAGTEQEWAAGVPYDLLDWLGSPVFYTLLVMGVFVVPPLYWAFLFWPMEGGCTSKQVSRMRKHAFQSAALGVCVGVVGYWVFVSLFASDAQLQYLSMADFDFDWDSTRVEFSYYTPLLGFLTAEALFLVPVLAPLLLTRAAAVPE